MSNKNAAKLPELIKNRNNRLNIKSKRRRNLIKKAVELRRLCGQEIYLLVIDQEQNKHHIYNSLDSVNQQPTEMDSPPSKIPYLTALETTHKKIMAENRQKLIEYTDNDWFELMNDNQPKSKSEESADKSESPTSVTEG